uniref:Protein CNPPD1 n=1 Tax=Panagrellus redivivus TaxID=6233 RepID=A0A7E4ZUL8_PANRE
MDNLTVPLTEMVVDYFDRHNSFDRLDLAFAAKVARDCCVDPTTLIVAMIYVDRLRRSNTSDFTEMTPDDLYLGSLVLATKFLQDADVEEYVWNDEWATCASRTVKSVNALELELLGKLDWNLNVKEEEFRDAVEETELYIARSCLRRHKFLTYNDLTVLVRNWDKSWSEIKAFFKFTSAISATYVSAVCVGIALASIKSEVGVDSLPTTSGNGSCPVEAGIHAAFVRRLEREVDEHEKRFAASFASDEYIRSTEIEFEPKTVNESCKSQPLDLLAPFFQAIDLREPLNSLNSVQIKCC